MKTLLIAAITILSISDLKADKRIDSIISEMNIREEGNCYSRDFSSLGAGDEQVPEEKLKAYYSTVYDSRNLTRHIERAYGNIEKNSNKIDAFLNVLRQPVFAKLLKSDRAIIAQCNRAVYKGYYASIDPERKRILAQMYYEMKEHIFHRRYHDLLAQYMPRTFAYFTESFKKRKIPLTQMEKKIKEATLRWNEQSLQDEKNLFIPVEVQDRFAYMHAPLSLAELNELRRLYNSSDFQNAYPQLRQGIFAAKKENLERFFNR